MTVFLIVVGFVVAWAAWFGTWLLVDRYLTSEDWDIVMVIFAVVLLLPTILVPGAAIYRQFAWHYGKRNCDRYSEHTTANVEWIDFSYWSYDCYIRQPDGTIIKVGNVRGIDDVESGES